MQGIRKDLGRTGKSGSLLPWPHRLGLVFVVIAFLALLFQPFPAGLLGQEETTPAQPAISEAAKRAAATITVEELKDEHITYLASEEVEGRAAGSEGGKKAGLYLAKEFKAYGLKPVGDDGTYFQDFSGRGMFGGKDRSMRNVVGYLEGSDPVLKDELIIVGAHYDHLGRGLFGSLDLFRARGKGPREKGPREKEIHNGADDNASGTAGVLELAEAFASLPANPKRSILFICFDGEEIGLCGSRHYVLNPIFPIEKTVLMVNLDMIGRCRADKLAIYGVGTSPGFEDLLNKLNEYADCQLELRLVKGSGMGSDHMSFASKVPTVFLNTGMHSDLHRPSDDVEKINGPGADKCATLAFLFTYAVVNQAERPTFTKIARRGGLAGLEGRDMGDIGEILRRILGEGGLGKLLGGPYLGVAPDPEGSEKGFLIGEVPPDTPAEKAGLKPGDIITQMDDKEIKNLEDLRSVLKGKEAGDEIKITILRKGTGEEYDSKEITAKLGKRGGLAALRRLGRKDIEPISDGPSDSQAGPRPYLGISPDSEGSEKGYLIKKVTPDSPAGKAGLKPDDIITEFDGKSIKTTGDLKRVLRSKKIEDEVKILILRDGETMELTAKLGKRPAWD